MNRLSLNHSRGTNLVALTTLLAILQLTLTNLNQAHAQYCAPEEIAKLVASDGAKNDQFGTNVDISNNIAIAGAPDYDDAAQNIGAAYIFRFDGTNWFEEATLLPPELEADDRFGTSVAVDGDLAIVSAIGDDDRGFAAGAVYVFRFDGSAWGRAQWVLRIPQNVLGWNLWLQAAQFENKTRVVPTYVVR